MRSLLHLEHRRRRGTVAAVAVLALLLAACGGAVAESDADTADEPSTETENTAEEEEATEAAPAPEVVLPEIVVTTSILGDLVTSLAGDDAVVTVLMPSGVDPHGYEPSAADGRILREADLIVANGLNLEESLVSVLDAVAEEGGRVLTLADQLDPIPFEWDGPDAHGDDDDHGHGDEDDHGHEDEDDHGHEDEDGHGHEDDDGHGHGDEDDHGHGDEDDHGHDDDDGHDDHDHGDLDPHFWFDPLRTADAVLLIAEELAAVDTNLDAAEWARRGEALALEIRALDEELTAAYATISPDSRVLVTNHDALGYLAMRYELQVIGTVIPGASTQAETDPRSFARLIETVERAGVSTIFAENTDSTVLAEQLAAEVVGRSDLEVEVVRIYTDALGEPGSGADTYLGLMRTTTALIVDALGSGS